MTATGFKIDKAPAVLDDWWPASNDKGGTVYVLKIIADMSDKRHAAELEQKFPGSTSLIDNIAAEEGAGGEWKAKGRLGELNVKLEDKSAQAVVVDIIGGKGWAPVLRVSRKAEKVEFIHQITAPLPKGVLKDLNDYRKADVLETLQVTQLQQDDLEDAVARKDRNKKKSGKGGNKTDQVQLDIAGVGDDIDKALAPAEPAAKKKRAKKARRR